MVPGHHRRGPKTISWWPHTTGPIAGRPGLIVQFSWFHATGGLHSGICSAAVLELPAPVPELVVRKESGLGRDLRLESEEFDAAFRVTGSHDRFSYDVLHPRVMEWLLANRGTSTRLGGNTLAVWRDGRLAGATELGELRDFAATLYGMIPGFAFTSGYPATPSPKIGDLTDLGPVPAGTVHLLQHLTHRGHDLERYEHARKLWGVTETAISVKISVPTVWPVLMIAAKRIASERGRRPRFDDGSSSPSRTTAGRNPPSAPGSGSRRSVSCPARRWPTGSPSWRATTSCSRTTACDFWRAAAAITPGHETVWTRANR